MSFDYIKAAARLSRISGALIIGWCLVVLLLFRPDYWRAAPIYLATFLVQPANLLNFFAAWVFFYAARGLENCEKKAGLAALAVSGALFVASLLFFSPSSIVGLALTGSLFICVCLGWKRLA